MMATPTEIIETVLDRLERPDLQSYAESRFPSALASVHTIRKFSRDLHDRLIVDFTNSNGRVDLLRSSALPRLREIQDIKEWQSYTEVSPGVYVPAQEVTSCTDEGYRKTRSLVLPRDYYGFEHKRIYTILGTQVVLQGVSAETQCLQILYLQWPLLETNPSSGLLETDSWIVDEFAYIVEAYLEVMVVDITRNREAIRAAQTNVGARTAEFIHANQSEILS